MNGIKKQKAFSIMGVLVASAIGIIVITGLTKLFVHMNTQLKQSEQRAQRTNLVSLIASYINSPKNCKETLTQILPELTAGTNKNFGKILSSGGGTVIDLDAEKDRIKAQYGMEGYLVFQFNCEEPGSSNPCKKCSGPYPCPPKSWSLSLISQNNVNGIPRFNNVFKFPVIITHTGADDYEFECNQQNMGISIDFSSASCSAGETLRGFDSNGNKICDPRSELLKNLSCPSGQVLRGFDSNGNLICV